MKNAIRFTLIAAALTVTSASFAADDTKWPTKPVQVIVPAGAGGDTDFNARTMARFFENDDAITLFGQKRRHSRPGRTATDHQHVALPTLNCLSLLFHHRNPSIFSADRVECYGRP